MFEFLISLPIFYILMGIAEYIIHRYTMHRRFFKSKALAWIFENHHISHHKHENFDHNIDLPFYFHLIVGSPVIILLGWFSVPALCAFLLICLYHAYSWTHCHRAIHGLEHNWLEKTTYYQKRKIHHEKHHQNVNKNYGVCFFFMDKLMGTKI